MKRTRVSKFHKLDRYTFYVKTRFLFELPYFKQMYSYIISYLMYTYKSIQPIFHTPKLLYIQDINFSYEIICETKFI